MKKLWPIMFILVVWGCDRQGSDGTLEPNDRVLNYNMKFDKLLLGAESSNSQFTLTSDLKIESLGITFPVGTILQKVEGDPATLSYVLPDGYKAIGQNSDGKARIAAGGSITCTCSQGSSGCSPYVASLGSNQTMGCAAGRCTSCNMKVTGGSPRLSATDEILSSVEIIDFSSSNPIHFVTTKAELGTLVSPSHTLMELKEVRDLILNFAKAYQISDLEALRKGIEPTDIPSSYTYLAVSIHGRLIMLPVEKEVVLSANPLLNELLRDADGNNARVARVYRCTCNSGSSGCVFQSSAYLVARAVYCEAGRCSSCTLGWT